MKQYLIPILVILVLALGLGGCQTTGITKPVPTKTDMPTMSQDEVCAMVYNYLENKGTAMTIFTQRMQFLDTLGKARPQFQAVYQGNGKWAVSTAPLLGQWNLYEASGVIEPADDNATNWLYYIQRFTVPQATTQQKPASQPGPPPTPTPAPTPAPPPSSQRQYYLQQAEYYQSSAKTDSDMANMALNSANSNLQLSQMSTQGSERDFYMRLYQSDMADYQRYIGKYASDQQMANEYLIKAQREP
jgi:hypothetical protein